MITVVVVVCPFASLALLAVFDAIRCIEGRAQLQGACNVSICLASVPPGYTLTTAR